MPRQLPIALLVLLSVGIFYGCSENKKSQVELGNELGILHKGNGDEPADVDPHTTTGMPEYHIQMALFEGLVTKHPETLEPAPAVAESWEISDDLTVYTFKIRQSARWSDGTPITAHDFVWSWQRALMPALGNQYAYSLFLVKNAEQFHKGEVSDFNEVGIKAIDPLTLQIELNSPTSYFLQLLDHHSLYPVPKHIVTKFGGMDERGTAWTRPENFVGNGPFVTKEWIPNQVFSVEKNPKYWDAATVKLNEIHFYPIQQLTTEERMFRSDQLHVTNSLPIEKIKTHKSAETGEFRNFPYFGTYYYELNVSKPPLDNPLVRKALAYSVDRVAITEHVTKGGQLPAYAFTPPGTLGYTAAVKQGYDIELARKFLADAGYPNGEGFPSLELLYNTHEDHRKIAVAIQQMWKNSLGIDVQLLNQDWKVYLNSKRTKDYQISRSAWIGDYLDPNTFLDMFITGGGNNHSGWSNTRYDELLAAAAMASNKAQRYAHFQEAEKILIEEAPIIPIYTYTRNFLAKNSVKGLNDNILDYHPYKYIYLSP